MLAVIGLVVSSTTRDEEKPPTPQTTSHGEMAETTGNHPVKVTEPVKHAEDAASGSELCLLGDAYKDQDRLDEALDSYKKAVWTDSPDDIIQYALDSATGIMKANKDWEGIAKLHGEFIARKPDSQLAVLSATHVARMYTRLGKSAEATEIIAKTLKSRIGDPAAVQVDFLLDELVKSMVPRKRARDIDADALDQQLKELLEKVAGPDANSTAKVRACYARVRLAQMLKRGDRSSAFLKDIARQNAKDPSVLSPALLSVSGDTLLKSGDVDGAEKMFQWLKDHHAAKFGNVGSIGLGNVALARKKPEDALRIFDEVLANHPAVPESNAATLGKLQALSELNRIDEAMKLASESLNNRAFKGESTARIHLLLGGLYEKKAAAAAGDEARRFLMLAHATYQRVYVAYLGFPDLCADGYLRAAGVHKKLGDEGKAREILKALAEHPNLQNTEAAKKAKAMLEAEGE